MSDTEKHLEPAQAMELMALEVEAWRTATLPEEHKHLRGVERYLALEALLCERVKPIIALVRPPLRSAVDASFREIMAMAEEDLLSVWTGGSFASDRKAVDEMLVVLETAWIDRGRRKVH